MRKYNKQNGKPSLKSFSAYLTDLMMFRETLTNESDRGVGLVCAAYIEDELRILLETSFIDDVKVIGRLFEQTGPAATFSAKIDLAFAVGLIGQEAHRGLHLIRKIRNEFAHSGRVRAFADQDISSRCNELMFLNPYVDENDPRSLYIRASISVIAEIHIASMNARHVPPAKGSSVVSERARFEKLRAAIPAVMSNLSEEQKDRLANSKTALSEKRKIVIEILRNAEVPEDDLPI